MLKKIKSIINNLTKKEIDNQIFNEISSIDFEFGYHSGRWSENEYIQNDIAFDEFIYITNKCDEFNFKYYIDWEWVENTAKEYYEELISFDDIININITEDNFWQFDFLASDIKFQLINHLKSELIR